MVAPDQILRVIARFEDYKGKLSLPLPHPRARGPRDDAAVPDRPVRRRACSTRPRHATTATRSRGDGCNASCDLEASFSLYGQARGGSVSATVSGVLVTIVTNAGQTPAQVMIAFAAAIGANSTLSAQGISAVAIGYKLVTNGTLVGPTLTDPGLSTQLADVPALTPIGLGLAALALLLVGLRPLTRRIA